MGRNELKIGEIGVIDGVRVECRPFITNPDVYEGCERCAFLEYDNEDPIGAQFCSANQICDKANRSDHTDVYFKKIEE